MLTSLPPPLIKTLRGPRGGVIMMGKDFPNPWGKKTPKGEIKMMSQLLDSAVFPGIQGGPLEHVIAAKAVAFGECLQPEYKEYQKQVQKNAKVLAQALIDRGFTIVSGGTDNHSMLVDLRTKYPDLTGKVAEKSIGFCRYHSKQKYGVVRQPFSIPDFGYPPGYSCYYNSRCKKKI